MAATDSRPIAHKNVAYRVTFPILDADGDLVTGAAALDSEISKDGGTFIDCTNEATEIATASGIYFLDLTATEMNADTVCVIVKTTTTGAKTTPIVIYPEEAGDVRVNVTQMANDVVTAAVVANGAIDAASFAAGAIDATAIANGAIDASTFAAGAIDAAAIANGAIDASTFAAGAIDAAAIANGAIDAATFAAGAIDAAAIATGAIDADSIAANAITAAKIATDAIGSAQLATAAADKVAAEVWDEARTAHAVAGTFGIGFKFARDGTATAGTLSTITLDAGATTTADFFNDCMIEIYGGTGAGQSRLITDYDSARVATVTPNWITAPDATSLFIIKNSARVDVGQWVDGAPAVLAAAGRMDSSVGAMAANVITPTAIQDGAFTDTKITASYVEKILRAVSGSVTAVTSTTVFTDTARTETITDVWKDMMIVFTATAAGSAQNLGIIRVISAFAPASDQLTVSQAFPQTPVIGDSYIILRTTVAGAAASAVRTECAGALADVNLDHLVGTATGIPAMPLDTYLYNALNKNASGTFDRTTDSLEANRDAMATTGAIADAVWDEDIVAAHGTTDTAGRSIRTLDAISDRTNNPNLNAVLGVPDTAGVDLGEEVADEVWNEDLGTHTTAGTFGRAAQVIRDGTAQAGAAGTITLDAGASATDDFYNATVIQIVAGTGANQSRVISDYTGASKVANVVPNWITAPDATSVFVIHYGARASVGLVNEVAINNPIAGRVDANAQVVGDKTGYSVGTGGIVAASFAAGAVDAAALATDAANEVRDAVWGKTMAELAAVPGVTADVLQALEWLFLLSRNKITQTATTQALRNDADTATVSSSALSDDGTTFVRAEWA